MSRIAPRIVAVTGIAAALALACVARSEPEEKRGPPVSLRDVQRNGIEGLLGVRLGTIVTVSGEVVRNQSRSKRDSSEPFFLRITSVDERALPKAVQYRFTPAMRDFESPKVGDTFRYVGYETGRFVGSPPREFDYRPAIATVGFGFETSFTVLAVAGQEQLQRQRGR